MKALDPVHILTQMEELHLKRWPKLTTLSQQIREETTDWQPSTLTPLRNAVWMKVMKFPHDPSLEKARVVLQVMSVVMGRGGWFD